MKHIQNSILLILLACTILGCGSPSLVRTSTPLIPTIATPKFFPTSIKTVIASSPTQLSVQAEAMPSPTPELSQDNWLSGQNPIPELAWAKDGKALAVAAVSGVYIFDTQTNLIIYSLEEGEFLFPLVMALQGQRLFARNRVWDMASGQMLYQLPLENPFLIDKIVRSRTIEEWQSENSH